MSPSVTAACSTRLERQRRPLQTSEELLGARSRAGRIVAFWENGCQKVRCSRPRQGLELACHLGFVANHGDIRRSLGIFNIKQASVVRQLPIALKETGGGLSCAEHIIGHGKRQSHTDPRGRAAQLPGPPPAGGGPHARQWSSHPPSR